jgi:hypothetical protein
MDAHEGAMDDALWLAAADLNRPTGNPALMVCKQECTLSVVITHILSQYKYCTSIYYSNMYVVDLISIYVYIGTWYPT